MILSAKLNLLDWIDWQKSKTILSVICSEPRGEDNMCITCLKVFVWNTGSKTERPENIHKLTRKWNKLFLLTYKIVQRLPVSLSIFVVALKDKISFSVSKIPLRNWGPFCFGIIWVQRGLRNYFIRSRVMFWAQKYRKACVIFRNYFREKEETKHREKTNIHSLWTDTRVNKYFPYLIQAFLLFIFSAAKPSLFVDLNRINFARETNTVLKRVRPRCQKPIQLWHNLIREAKWMS